MSAAALLALTMPPAEPVMPRGRRPEDDEPPEPAPFILSAPESMPPWRYEGPVRAPRGPAKPGKKRERKAQRAARRAGRKGR